MAEQESSQAHRFKSRAGALGYAGGVGAFASTSAQHLFLLHGISLFSGRVIQASLGSNPQTRLRVFESSSECTGLPSACSHSAETTGPLSPSACVPYPYPSLGSPDCLLGSANGSAGGRLEGGRKRETGLLLRLPPCLESQDPMTGAAFDGDGSLGSSNTAPSRLSLSSMGASSFLLWLNFGLF